MPANNSNKYLANAIKRKTTKRKKSKDRKKEALMWGGAEIGLHPKGKGVGGSLGYSHLLGTVPIPYGSIDIGGPEYGFMMGATPDPGSELGLSPLLGARFGHPRRSGVTRQFPRGIPDVIYDKLRGRTKQDAINLSYPDLEEDRAERAAKKQEKADAKAEQSGEEPKEDKPEIKEGKPEMSEDATKKESFSPFSTLGGLVGAAGGAVRGEKGKRLEGAGIGGLRGAGAGFGAELGGITGLLAGGALGAGAAGLTKHMAGRLPNGITQLMIAAPALAGALGGVPLGGAIGYHSGKRISGLSSKEKREEAAAKSKEKEEKEEGEDKESSLKGKQKKIDMNKNNKIDGQDLAILRKQETKVAILRAARSKHAADVGVLEGLINNTRDWATKNYGQARDYVTDAVTKKKFQDILSNPTVQMGLGGGAIGLGAGGLAHMMRDKDDDRSLLGRLATYGTLGGITGAAAGEAQKYFADKKTTPAPNAAAEAGARQERDGIGRQKAKGDAARAARIEQRGIGNQKARDAARLDERKSRREYDNKEKELSVFGSAGGFGDSQRPKIQSLYEDLGGHSFR